MLRPSVALRVSSAARRALSATPAPPNTAPATRLAGFDLPTVWSEFTPLATTSGAINLGQGFPDWQAPAFAKDCIKAAVDDDHNQYCRPWGHVGLVDSLAANLSASFERDLNPLEEIVVTNGCSQGLQLAFAATLNEGDECIIMEPAMDIYAAQIQLAGGVAVSMPLRHVPKDDAPSSTLSASDFIVDLEELEAKITPRTKVLMFNTPHNPSKRRRARCTVPPLLHNRPNQCPTLRSHQTWNVILRVCPRLPKCY